VLPSDETISFNAKKSRRQHPIFNVSSAGSPSTLSSQSSALR